MRKFAAGVGLVVWLAASSAWGGITDGNRLLKECEDSINVLRCYGYIAGVSDASEVVGPDDRPVVRADEAFEGTRYGFRWCMAKEVLTGQAKAVVVRWLKAHPETWHYNASGLVAAALAEAFPCKD